MRSQTKPPHNIHNHPVMPTQSKKPLFVFVCDSYFDRDDETGLEALGLVKDETFDHAGAGGATNIFTEFRGTREVDAEHLLIFTGSFHGDVDDAVKYAKKVKEVNPNAKIYFRSSTESCDDPVFDGTLRKREKDRFHSIIREFMEAAHQAAWFYGSKQPQCFKHPAQSKRLCGVYFLFFHNHSSNILPPAEHVKIPLFCKGIFCWPL